MSKAKIDKEKLLKKFKTLSVASICIQKTSKYLYQFYKSSDSIVNVWLDALNSVNSDSARISLFYIANEMLQSKNYGSNYFKQSWKPHLAHSIDCIKESSVNDKIRRILNIWIERKVYEKSFVDDLINRLSTSKSPALNDDHCKEIIMNFDPDEAMERLKELITVENRTTDILKQHESAINFDEKTCKEQIKKLKDKNHCNQFSEQLDGNVNHLFHVCTALEEELKIRTKAIEAMTNADIYYETQKKETLVVEDAYRRYGNLILKTKDAIEEHLEFLMEDGGPVDIDDAPSPGNTPPYLYEESFKHISKDSPISYDDVVSPSQSMDMSEDDTPLDKSSYLDKPYSPSHQIHSSKSVTSEYKPPLSSSEALQLLTSVFSQSLTKKTIPDMNTKVNLQSDIFRNTLTTPVKSTSDDVKSADTTDKSSTVFADAFRLISNLTGLKNIGERTLKSDSATNSGSTIPILTTNSSFKNSDEINEPEHNPFPFNQPNFSTANIQNGTDSIPRLLYPDIQMTSFPPPMFNQQSSASNVQMFPVFNSASVPPPPMPALFNNMPLGFNLTPMRQTNPRTSQSPGSCTEDEDDGGATPTQDEPALLNPMIPPPMFNQHILPALATGTPEDINKQIQNAISGGTLPFGLPNMLSVPKDRMPLSPWNTMPGQFPFNINNCIVPPHMTIPFSMMNQNPQIQPIFIPVSNSAPIFGPPRAIRTKRPNADPGTNAHDESMDNNDDSVLSSQTPPQRPHSENESMLSDNPLEDLEPITQSNNVAKPTDNDSDIINLYGDVEEELDRNYNSYQQSINVRSSRPPAPVDRYHLYNNQMDPPPSINNYRHYDQQSSQNSVRPPRMNYVHTNNYPRNQLQPRAGYLPYYPNRTTNFRPKNNYNMFN